MELSLSIFEDSLPTVEEYLLLDEHGRMGPWWACFVPGRGVGIGRWGWWGLEEINRSNAASGWKVIQGGGEEEAIHYSKSDSSTNTFLSTLGFVQFGSKVTKVTQSISQKPSRTFLPFNTYFFPLQSHNVQQRSTTNRSASPGFMIQTWPITLFPPIHFLPHCLPTAAIAFDKSIWSWSGHSFIHCLFPPYVYSSFKAFGYRYLTNFLAIILATLTRTFTHAPLYLK